MSNLTTPCGFNQLTPAFIFSANLTSLNVIGELDIGTSLNYGQATGGMRSVDGYPTRVNATAVHLDDLPTADASNFHLNVRGVVVTDDGTYIAYTAYGPVALTDKVNAIFSGAPNATATEWGEMYSALFWKFQVKNGPYQDLEDSFFVSSARVFPGSADGKYAASLEYRISKLETGPECQDP